MTNDLPVYDTIDQLIIACNDFLTVKSWSYAVFMHDQRMAILAQFDRIEKLLRKDDDEDA